MSLRSEAGDYLGNSHKYWEQALAQLESGEAEKASELAWESVVERIKALYFLKTKTKLSQSHRDVKSYVRSISQQLEDKELYNLFHEAESLHANFYERFKDLGDVRESFLNIQKLLTKIDALLYRR
jgi:hypothetical protein